MKFFFAPVVGILVPITKISKPGKSRPKAQRISLDISYWKLDVSSITSKINTGVMSCILISLPTAAQVTASISLGTFSLIRALAETEVDYHILLVWGVVFELLLR